ncbi:MAG: membrane protein insertase YidC [Methylophilaceae bacterium]|jgi:YidC/Oxa1 family membrane protein insertase
MDVKRLILFVVLSFSILFFWNTWQEKRMPVEQVASSQTNNPVKTNAAGIDQETQFRLQTDKRVLVQTDLFKAEIDTMGGDLRKLELTQHRAADSETNNFVLLNDQAAPSIYVVQSGIAIGSLATHKELFTSTATSYQMAADQNELKVALEWSGADGVKLTKTYTFVRGSYQVKVDQVITNGSAAAIDPLAYYQIVHDSESNQGTKMMPTFTGGAYFTDADKYKKVKFTEMAKEPLSKTAKDGWVGLVQHYFVGAWIPQGSNDQTFYTKDLGNKIFAIGTKSNLASVAPGATENISAKLYLGPQKHDELIKAAPGLEFTVDYGWLTFIASPLFMVLSAIQSVVGNWGFSIILLTVLIKLLFYPLSASGYRNMAQMRELAPRLQLLKDKFGDDRQKMQQAMMEMYKKEKINPMGGCLPILVQIPVFISLYWMLLASVEMRHAPFVLWIHDLSAPDALFGHISFLGDMPLGLLPILMGLSMIVQTKLNPKPTDPVQAKVMMIMPLAFSVFFFFFPAGLVLYWLVNNILSIAQQARINHLIHAAALAKKKGNAVR